MVSLFMIKRRCDIDRNTWERIVGHRLGHGTEPSMLQAERPNIYNLSALLICGQITQLNLPPNKRWLLDTKSPDNRHINLPCCCPPPHCPKPPHREALNQNVDCIQDSNSTVSLQISALQYRHPCSIPAPASPPLPLQYLPLPPWNPLRPPCPASIRRKARFCSTIEHGKYNCLYPARVARKAILLQYMWLPNWR